MLMLLNPLNTLFTNSESKYFGLSVPEEKYYVLDTFDLTVETATVAELVAALKLGVVIVNVKLLPSGSGLLFSSDKWYFANNFDGTSLVSLNGYLGWSNEVVTISNIDLVFGLEFDLITKDKQDALKLTLFLNEFVLCYWTILTNELPLHTQMLYYYKVSDYIVMRYRIVYTDNTADVLAVIADRYGNIIDIISNNGEKIEGFVSKDPQFSAKYVALYKNRY